jgi:hypothetical protein
MSFLSDSNQRPTDYKSVALPTELRKLIGRVFSKTLSVHVPPTLNSFLRSQPLQVHLLRIFIHPGVQYRLRGADGPGFHRCSFRLHRVPPPSGWLDSVLLLMPLQMRDSLNRILLAVLSIVSQTSSEAVKIQLTAIIANA